MILTGVVDKVVEVTAKVGGKSNSEDFKFSMEGLEPCLTNQM